MYIDKPFGSPARLGSICVSQGQHTPCESHFSGCQINIPRDVDYDEFPSLSNEIKEKLSKIRPETLGQASRIDGVTPAALSFILAYIKTRAKSQKLA